jgi:hypothetical protein
MVPYLSNRRIFLSNRKTFYAMSLYLKISANFRTGATLPTIEEQYHDLWKMASTLEKIGLPIDDWCTPAHTPANARLNAAFTAAGTTDAALALARADEGDTVKELRTIAIWNGKNDVGGATLITTYNSGRIPSNLRLSEESIPAFSDYEHVVQIVRAIVEIWEPMLVKVTPWGYPERQVFKDRPPVGWMIYLPFELTSNQIPEAAKLVAIGDTRKKGNAGTLVISTTDVFDVDNQEHVNNANAIETRLVDQDLLPTFREFVIRF